MWIFDGEEWTEEGASEDRKPASPMPQWNECSPELQVLEIVPVPQPRTQYIPPVPMP
jgi:hypothetical protein